MAASGNFSWGAFSSCKQTMSGIDSLSQRSNTGRRPFTPLTLYVAIFMQEFVKFTTNISNSYKMIRSQSLHLFLWPLRVAGFSLAAITLLNSCKEGSATAGYGAMPPPALPVFMAAVRPVTTYQDFPASVQGKRD